MRQLFASATLRLTAWYLIILACISLLFSIIVYQIAGGEVERRLARYQDKSWSLVQPSPRIAGPRFESVRSHEIDESRAVIIGVLIYVNLFVIGIGGVCSYLLARRTLRPIERAHDAQTRFASDASHELRTPLATMTTELEVALQDTAASRHDLKATLTSTLEEVQRLTALSSTLLALSSGNADPLPTSQFNLAAAVNAAAARFHTIDDAIITVISPSETMLTVGNQASIEELLAILLDNAIKYGRPGTPITLCTTLQNGRYVVAVTNYGKGINAADIPFIFDRFYRADASRTGTTGHGLGLALAQQIAIHQNTHITVTSDPDATTVFSFALPKRSSNS